MYDHFAFSVNELSSQWQNTDTAYRYGAFVLKWNYGKSDCDCYYGCLILVFYVYVCVYVFFFLYFIVKHFVILICEKCYTNKLYVRTLLHVMLLITLNGSLE